MEENFTDGNLRRLSDANLDVAENEPDVRGWTVTTSDGDELGDVEDLIVDTSAMKVRYIEVDADDDAVGTVGTVGTTGGDGHGLFIPIQSVDLDRDAKRVIVRGAAGSIRSMVPADFGQRFAAGDRVERTAGTSGTSGATRDAGEVQRMTRAEEEVHVSKREVEAGEVRVGKHVETTHVRENVAVSREQVHVERRPVTDTNASAEIRASEHEIRVPIVEEEVVVEKRPVVKEELIVSKERVQETRPVDVETRKEEFDIREERTSADKPYRGGER